VPRSLFDPGLEHVAVAETERSDIDGERGELRVCGFPIEELAAEATYEECVFVLFNGRLPTADELATFRSELASRRTIGAAERSVLRHAVEDGLSPMAALRMGMAAASFGTSAEEPEAHARRVVAVAPTIVAAYWRFRQGREPISPDEDLSHAANYLYMLTAEEPTEARFRGLDTFLVTIAEHGLNPSTFTARVIASTGATLVSAATGAIGALEGPRHGGNLDDVLGVLRAADEADDLERYVREQLVDEDRPTGFGHRVYRVQDPRGAVLAAAGERSDDGSEDVELIGTARELADVAPEILSAHHSSDRVAPTVELDAAALLDGLDVPVELFTATFAVARVGGWMAHCLEQRETDALVRPSSRYTGATERSWVPRGDRYAAGDTILERPLESTLEPISETLATLSEPSRLELLIALHDGDGPQEYATLKDATSIDDKGRFNYHLRQLQDYFVSDPPEGYVLTDAGRTLVRTVLTDEQLLRNGLD
jgi:citrate synthase